MLVGLAPCARCLHLVESAARDRLAQRGEAAAEPVVHGDDAVADDDAERRLAVGDIACEFHASNPASVRPHAEERCEATRLEAMERLVNPSTTRLSALLRMTPSEIYFL